MTAHMSPAQYRALKPKKRHKYGAKPKTVDGIRFHSTGEAMRYLALKLLERAGEISLLHLQRKFMLVGPNGSRIGYYIADFDYVENGLLQVEDYKGFDDRHAKWKRAHFADQYGFKILITGPAAKKRRPTRTGAGA